MSERLSVRRGVAEPFVPADGVPLHLRSYLKAWLERALGIEDRLSMRPNSGLITSLILDLQLMAGAQDLYRQGPTLVDECVRDEDTFLDVIDQLLCYPPIEEVDRELLESLLDRGGSMWRVGDGSTGLQERVDPTAQDAFNEATAVEDAASADLASAWDSAYGREPDSSAAWSLSIRAVEHLLAPLVIPDDGKPSLGKAARAISDKPGKWQATVDEEPGGPGIQAITALLSVLTYNSDRHGGSPGYREPTLHEVRFRLQAAVTLVQWLHDGTLGRA